MKKVLFSLALVLCAFGISKAQLSFSITQAVCFNSLSPSSNTTTAYVVTSPTNANQFYWNIAPANSTSACVGSYTGSGSTNTNVTITFPCCGVYTITCYAMNGSTTVATSAQVMTVGCNPGIYVTSPTNYMTCSGSAAIIYAHGGNNYVWSDGTNTISTSNMVSVTPTATTCYTVTGSIGSGCTNSAVACVSVGISPTVAITGTPSNTNNCQYSSYSLTASGAASYAWIPTWLGTGANKATFLGSSPCYTVIGTSSSGCTASAVHCPTFQTGPSVNISASPGQTVCQGTGVTLSVPAGATSFTWETGWPSTVLSNSSTAYVTPTLNAWNNYSITATNSLGCISYSNITLYVSQPPSVTLYGGNTMCAGGSRTLVANFPGPHTWSVLGSPVGTGSVIVVSPTVNTCYTIAHPVTGCVRVTCITMASPPSLTVTASNACQGGNALISAQGASLYSISGSSVSTSNGYFSVMPSSNTCYTVTGNTGGCTSTAVACVTVVTPPTYTGNVSSATVCAGNSLTLATSPTSYNWNVFEAIPNAGSIYLGTTIGTLVAATPTASMIYSVMVNAGPCYVTFVTTVTVIQPLTINISGPSTLCAGSSINLSASGANNYVWSNNATGAMISVSPSSSTCFSVTGTNNFGCSAMAVKCVTVLTTPVVISPASATVCLGTSHTFTGSGATTYTWSTSANTSTLNVLPSITTTYTLSGTGSNGCVGSAVATLVVNPNCSDVWPGDANSDGVVGTTDVLEIGLAFLSTGASRSPGGNNYVAQHATNWSGTVSSGKNKCHADCDGSGTVTLADTMAIFTNFGQSHPFRLSAGSDPEIRVVSDAQYFIAGAWNKVDIYEGDETDIQLYGLTFDLGFDNTLVEENEAYLVYTSSFLNNNIQNVEFRKGDFENGIVYAASVRTDHTNVTGRGKIGEFHFKIREGTAGQYMALSAANSERVDKDGNHTNQDGNSLLVQIAADDVSINEYSVLRGIRIQPNPASDNAVITSSNSKVVAFKVTDISGRTLQSGTFTGSTSVGTENIASGVYFIHCTSGGLQSTHKLVIQH